MRIALAAIIILCGANLLIELLDSSMVDVIKERNETINARSMPCDGRQSGTAPLAKCPDLVYLIGVEGTAPLPPLNSSFFSHHA